jgi:hypothetical protein
MSWAAHRSARFEEDIAYSLLGIFSVNISVIYGEGRKAFQRLQEKILRNNTLDASLFAWHPMSNQKYRGMLAQSPSEFRHFAHGSSSAPPQFSGGVRMSSAGLIVAGAFAVQGELYDFILRLSGAHEDDLDHLPILLKEWDDQIVRLALAPHEILSSARLHKDVEGMAKEICVRREVDQMTSQIIENSLPRSEGNECLLHESSEASRKTRDETLEDARFMAIEARPPLCGLWAPTKSNYYSVTYATTGSSSKDTTTISQEAVQDNDVEYGISHITSGAQGSALENRELHNDSEFNYESSLTDQQSVSELSSGSEEYDMYLFELSSQDNMDLDLSAEFAELKDELTEMALETFTKSTSNSYTSVGRFKAMDPSPQTRKRLTIEYFNDWIQVDQNEVGVEAGTVFVGYPRPKKLRFACPFYVRNSEEYRSCLTRVDLRGIRDLKQHLCTAHRRPQFCPICCDTFETAATCDDHIRSRMCNPKEAAFPEGISELQMENLARRKNTPQSEELQWRSVWGIIFPTADIPSQPYLIGNVESVVCVMREYWLGTGQDVVSDFLEKKALRDYSLKDEERNLEALYWAVLEGMLDSIVASFRGDYKVSDGKIGEMSAIIRHLWSWSPI